MKKYYITQTVDVPKVVPYLLSIIAVVTLSIILFLIFPIDGPKAVAIVLGVIVIALLYLGFVFKSMMQLGPKRIAYNSDENILSINNEQGFPNAYRIIDIHSITINGQFAYA